MRPLPAAVAALGVSSRGTRRVPSFYRSGGRGFSSSRCAGATTMAKQLVDPARELLDEVDAFIFDCDGVIWKGEAAIPLAAEALARLATQHDKRAFFVTNNSTRTRAQYKTKLDRLGLGQHAAADQILSSSFAAAAHLKQAGFDKSGKLVFVIGEHGIMGELALAGITAIGGPDYDRAPELDMSLPETAVEVDGRVGAVVVGLDRGLNYYKLQLNTLVGCEFIATNLDATAHLTKAQAWAGAGTMVGAVRGCTSREPTLVGKPSPLMLDYLCSEFGLERHRVCMVGDRLDTDIRFGRENGMRTVLVMSGVTSQEQLDALPAKATADPTVAVPEFYTESICTLVP